MFLFLFLFFSLPVRFKTFDITKPLWLENTIVIIDLALYGMKSSDEALQWTHAQLSSDTCDRLNSDHVPKKNHSNSSKNYHKNFAFNI